MTTAELLALLDERKQLAALFRENRMACAYAEHLAIASVEKAIAALVQDGLNLDGSQKIGATSLATVVVAIRAALKDEVQFAKPATVWNHVGFSGVATMDWPQVLKERILALTAPLEYVIERDGVAA